MAGLPKDVPLVRPAFFNRRVNREIVVGIGTKTEAREAYMIGLSVGGIRARCVREESKIDDYGTDACKRPYLMQLLNEGGTLS